MWNTDLLHQMPFLFTTRNNQTTIQQTWLLLSELNITHTAPPPLWLPDEDPSLFWLLPPLATLETEFLLNVVIAMILCTANACGDHERKITIRSSNQFMFTYLDTMHINRCAQYERLTAQWSHSLVHAPERRHIYACAFVCTFAIATSFHTWAEDDDMRTSRSPATPKASKSRRL